MEHVHKDTLKCFKIVSIYLFIYIIETEKNSFEGFLTHQNVVIHPAIDNTFCCIVQLPVTTKLLNTFQFCAACSPKAKL